MDDGAGDYGERTYIYNSGTFWLPDDATFVVDANGAKSIINYRIVPYGDDNFDFQGGGGITDLGNAYLQPRIDPSDIGRTVTLHFTGSVTPTTYTQNDFNIDVATIVGWNTTPHAALALLGPQITGDLFDAGITRFVTGDGFAIQWGTNGADNLTSHTVADAPFLSDFAEFGQVFYLGAGADNLVIDRAGAANFRVFGGSGVDKVDLSTMPASDAPGSGADIHLTDVEDFVGSDYHDYVYVTDESTSNVEIRTGAGDDFVTAGDGNDYVVGGAGDDDLQGGFGNDVMEGGSGRDTVAGGTGADHLIAVTDDLLRGEAGPDLITADETSTMVGGFGDDYIDATGIHAFGEQTTWVDVGLRLGDGHDWVAYGEGNQRLRVNSDTLGEDSIDLRIGGPKRLISIDGGENETPLSKTFEVKVYLMVGDASIYLGYGEWTEDHDSNGGIDREYLSFFRQPEVTLSDRVLDWDIWFSEHEVDSTLENFDQGEDAYYLAAAFASNGADSISGGSGDDDRTARAATTS